jgi:quinol monooxygenase YgiN
MFARGFARRLTFLALAAVAAVCVLARPTAFAQNDDEPHPIVAAARAALKDRAKPFTLAVRLKLQAGNAEQFEAIFAKAAKLARAEKGCLTYELNRDAKGESRYLVYERWENLAALEAHIKSPHFLELSDEVGPMLEGPPDIDVLVPVGN